MKWLIATVGKPKLAYAREGAEEYLGRLRPLAEVEWRTVKASSRDREGEALLAAAGGLYRVVLDERGRDFTSVEWAERARGWAERGGAAFLIGGADGHADAVRGQAGELVRLSRFTLQHELALVVLLEQLYRAHQIWRGSPYHRA